MTRLTVICSGRIKEKYYTEAAGEYIKRLGAYCSVEIIELREERLPDSPSPAEIDAALRREAARILEKIPRGAHVVAMCVEGREPDSEELSRELMGMAAQSAALCFIIGSSHGLHEDVKQAARLRLSVSKMTLPHSLARVVLLEQLYRAFNIASNGKYHK